MKRRYLIGEVAKYFDISTDTLRYYDKQGIISPNKDEQNGYRYYDYDDILKIVYILTLKSLDVKLEDIKGIINNCTLEELMKLMKQQEEQIDKKLENLNRLKKTVRNFESDIEMSIRLLDKYEIVQSPVLLYKEISKEEEITKGITEMEKEEKAYSICYSVIIDKKYVESDNLEENLCDGISGIAYNNLENAGEYRVYERTKSLHTVVKIIYDDTKEDMQAINEYCKKIIRYINKNGFKVSGDTLCRYVTFENKGGKSIDYIEVWIPIK